MKSEHRHELKTNELADWLVHFPQWAKKNRSTIIYVAILIVVVAGLYIWRYYDKNVITARRQFEFTQLVEQLPQRKIRILQQQNQGIDSSYILIQPAEVLEERGTNSEGDQAALALIKSGEALRMELLYRLELPLKQEKIDQIEKAKASYSAAIAKNPPSPAILAAAKFGLGICEEEIGNFEKAEEIYTELSEDPDLKDTVGGSAAAQRLSSIGQYQQKIVFKRSPKPSPVKAEAQLVKPEAQIKIEEAKIPDNNS